MRNAVHPAKQEKPADPMPRATAVRLEPMNHAQLDSILVIEAQSQLHPWQRRQFADCLAHGHHAQVLLADDTLLGYCVAMMGHEEAHLLTLAVSPGHQRQGHARTMLNALSAWSLQQAAQSLWLEVRVSNARAMHVYQAAGFQKIALRRAYYPAQDGLCEDAQVMCLTL